MVAPAAHTTTPASPDVNNGAAITTGVRFTVAATTTCDGIAFRPPTTNSGTYTGVLWQTTSDDEPLGSGTGTELASASVAAGSVTPGTWAVIPFSARQTLSPGVVYTAGVHASSGRIVATSGGLASAITGNGVTLLAAGTNPNPPNLGNMFNGVFTEGATPTYPATAFNQTDYFVDISIVTGQFVAVGTAVETDTALPITLQQGHVVSVGVATETDAALPVVPGHRPGPAVDVVVVGGPQRITVMHGS